MWSPQIGSPVLYCYPNSVTLFQCSRVMALAVVEALTKVCDDCHVVVSLVDEECSCARFRGVNMDHEIFRNIRELEHWHLGVQLLHCCVRLVMFYDPTFSNFLGGLFLREGLPGVL